MRELYLPENNIEAYLLQGALQAEQIECEIRGEYLQGGVGLLPAGNNLSLWVEESQWEQACDLLRRYERGELATE